MRIIAGDWRGRKLVAPKGDVTRPTADRTRETMFNMLTSRLGSFEDLRVADLFAGSGALGLEALSRGAAHCQFVEHEPGAIKAIRSNIATFEARQQCEVTQGSVMTLGPVRQPFDLILLDPPYETGAGWVALDRLTRLGWIGPASWMVVETSAKESLDAAKLTVDAERKIGKAKLTILRQA